MDAARPDVRAARVEQEHQADPPAVIVVAVDDVASLEERDPVGTGAALREVARRLDRLVRSSDLLGLLGPGEFAFATPSLSAGVAGALVERIEGAVAMPLEIAGEALSLGVTVGIAFATPGERAASLVPRAEAEVVRRRTQG
jgi:PleD family two-component response regulator